MAKPYKDHAVVEPKSNFGNQNPTLGGHIDLCNEDIDCIHAYAYVYVYIIHFVAYNYKKTHYRHNSISYSFNYDKHFLSNSIIGHI